MEVGGVLGMNNGILYILCGVGSFVEVVFSIEVFFFF